MMSDDSMFDSIAADLAAGHTENVSAKTLAIAEGSSDPYVLLKCISLLKTLPNDGTQSRIGNRLVDIVTADDAYEVANALYQLDYPYFSLLIAKKIAPEDKVHRLICHCQFDMEEYESALDTYQHIKDPVINDRILLAAIHSSLGEHSRSIEIASALLVEAPDDYDVRIAYVSSLMSGGHDKEVARYIREGIKDRSADSNAVAAYVLRIQGNIKAAGGYASRAVKIDNGHIGGMETLGICLALKEEYEKARIVAGAINEISPGNKAAINVLSYCEGH